MNKEKVLLAYLQFFPAALKKYLFEQYFLKCDCWFSCRKETYFLSFHQTYSIIFVISTHSPTVMYWRLIYIIELQYPADFDKISEMPNSCLPITFFFFFIFFFFVTFLRFLKYVTIFSLFYFLILFLVFFSREINKINKFHF